MAPRKRRGRAPGAAAAQQAGSASNSIASSPSSHPASKSDNDSADRGNPSRGKAAEVGPPRGRRDATPADRSMSADGDEERPEDDPKTLRVLKAYDDAQAVIAENGGREQNFTIAGVAAQLYKEMIDWAITEVAVQFKRSEFLAAEARRQRDFIAAGGDVNEGGSSSEKRPLAKIVQGGYGSRLLYSEKNVTVECSNCSSNISASRYAQHVEKCLGRGGRMSSRAASARLRASAERAEKEAAADLDDVPPRRRRHASSGFSDGESAGYGGIGSSKRRKMSPVPSGGSHGSFQGRGGLPPSGRTRASPQ